MVSRGAGLVAAASLLAASAQAQFNVLLFSDNYLTEIAAPGDTTDLSTNIGAAGGRQGGTLVTDINPAGFGYTLFGTTSFSAGNGWDLRAQANWPAAGPIDVHTLRYRNNLANEWSTATPNIGFSGFIVDNSYRIQAQLTHAVIGTGDRWAAVSFGAQPDTRFPAAAGNAGFLVTNSGGVQVFNNGDVIGGGVVDPVPTNGAFEVDLRILNNVGALYINSSLVAADLDFSGTTPAWIGFTGFSSADGPAQMRFDNLAVSTVPEPSAAALLLGLGVLGVAVGGRRRR